MEGTLEAVQSLLSLDEENALVDQHPCYEGVECRVARQLSAWAQYVMAKALYQGTHHYNNFGLLN